MLSPTYEIATDVMSSDELVRPVYVRVLLLFHTDEMLSRPCEIRTVIMSHGGVSQSTV